MMRQKSTLRSPSEALATRGRLGGGMLTETTWMPTSVVERELVFPRQPPDGGLAW
jgi:hypothetical protein